MTRAEAIREACRIVGIAYRSIGDYSEPSDGFCDDCPAAGSHEWNFQHSGKTLEFVRAAVVEKLEREGFTVDAGV